MKAETKQLIASELYSLCKWLLIGAVLALIPFGISRYWAYKGRYGYEDDYIGIAIWVLLIPAALMYLIRLYKWVMKWKNYKP